MAENKEKRYVSDNAQLIAEWDWEKNDEIGLNPNKATCGSAKKAWWKCSSGHSFYKSIDKMHKNQSCPICSGHKTVTGVNDFATCYPEIAKEWHPTKNGDVLPTDISKKNGRKYGGCVNTDMSGKPHLRIERTIEQGVLFVAVGETHLFLNKQFTIM